MELIISLKSQRDLNTWDLRRLKTDLKKTFYQRHYDLDHVFIEQYRSVIRGKNPLSDWKQRIVREDFQALFFAYSLIYCYVGIKEPS